MKLEEGKEQFIEAWGALGSNWGINRTMAQIHALLLISTSPMCAENIMEELKISRGNANMNIRALIDWGLVYKKIIPGERKEFFIAEKDLWLVVKQVIEQRRKKELEPMLSVLSKIHHVEDTCEESKEFKKVIEDLILFANRADSTLSTFVKSNNKWVVSTLLNIMK